MGDIKLYTIEEIQSKINHYEVEKDELLGNRRDLKRPDTKLKNGEN